MEDEELLTVAQVVEQTGISFSGIKNAMNRGKLPFVEKYGRRLVKPADVEAWRGAVRRGRPIKNEGVS